MKQPRRTPLGVAIAAAASVAWLVLSGCVDVVQADDVLNVDVAAAFAFAGTQLGVLADDVLAEEDVFTDYTDTDGQWITVKDNGDSISKTVWTSGMVAGMYWYQYEATGAEIWKTDAEFFLEGLGGVEQLDDNDLGFQVLNSFGLGYRLTSSTTEKDEYLERVLTGAASLYDFKWDENIPAFWSWEEPSSRPEWMRAVNVDMMMNMEIMLWASVNGGPEDYATYVASHADSTWKDIVREDNSTFHVADYDPDTGELVDQGTYQGWTDDSTWSRGQAWAVYGYVMVYRFLQEPRFLERCLAVFQYWEDNLPEDFVPPADYDAPVSASDNGKDSSATAVVASALIELFITTEDPMYLVKAQQYLSALLSADYYLPDATDGWQSILRRATAKWGEPEVGAVFGDYFLLETMVRYKKLAPSIVLWEEAEVNVTAGAGARRNLQALSGGEFCALTVSEGTLVFADADCEPVAPDFSAVEVAVTPAPAASDVVTDAPMTTSSGVTSGGTSSGTSSGTPSPTVVSRDVDETSSPRATFSPLPDAVTRSPSVTLAPLVTPEPTSVEATFAPLTTSETRSPSATLAPVPRATPAPTTETTPSPTSSPSSALSPVDTPSPSAAATSGNATLPSGGTSAPSSAAAGGSSSAVFGTLTLDNDVDLSYLDPTADVLVWFSLTLSNVENTPSSLVLESEAGDTVTANVTAPTGGWVAGENTVSFTLPTDALVAGTWSTVASASVTFEASATALSGSTTAVTLHWLIFTHELVL